MTQPDLEKPIADISLAEGLWLEDDWYALRRLDAQTLAIGEPAYHQCNWSYLISGGGESLLWDTGSGRRAIAPLVARHGKARVTAFPSHMHYDHLGGIGDFGPVILADLPCLRAQEQAGRVTPREEMFLGAYEDLKAPEFAVGRWITPGEAIRLGARRLEVLHTPGHSPDSVSLWEKDRNRLYAADLLYPGPLYAQVPGASLRDYARTLQRLSETLPQDVEIVCAHGQEEAGRHGAPILGRGDLRDALRVIASLLREPPQDTERAISARMQIVCAAQSWS